MTIIEIFCTNYMLSQLFLFPALVYYVRLDIMKVPHTQLKKIRVITSLATILLPLILSMSVFYQPNSTTSSAKVENSPTIAPAIRSSLHPEITIPTAKPQLRHSAPVPLTRQIIASLSAPVQHGTAFIELTSVILQLLTVIGILLFIFRICCDLYRINALIRTSHKQYLQKNTTLYLNPNIDSPFSVWAGKGMIFMPFNLSEKAKAVILSHERCHLRHRHTFWVMLDVLHTYLFWYNPISHLLKRKNSLLLELECDVEAAETNNRIGYASILSDYAHDRQYHRQALIAIQGFGSLYNLAKRLRYLLDDDERQRNSSRWRCFIGLLAFLTIIGFTAGCASKETQREMAQKINDAYTTLSTTHGEVLLSDMPPILIKAFLFREDAHFYAHSGIDVSAIFRAAYNNVTGDHVQGASTITQQLAKRFVLEDTRRTFNRKIKQFFAARTIEKNLSKDRILEIYLNSLYFENGIYGVAAATLHYFKHPLTSISPAEAAALAVIVSHPAENSFTRNPVKAKALQTHLLNRMVAEGYVSESEAGDSLNSFWQFASALPI